MTLTLYYDPYSGPARSVIIFLDFIKDTSVERKYVCLAAKEQLKPEYLEINPHHTVPCLKDNESGLVLYESIAILQYLAEKFDVTGKFGLPTEEKAKWQVINALHNQPHFVNKTIYQQIRPKIFVPLLSGQPFDVNALIAGIEASKETFIRLEAILKKNGGFIASASPTVADIRPWLDVFQLSNLGGQGTLEIIDFSLEYPEIQKWLLSIKQDLYSEDLWKAVANLLGPVAEEKFGGPVFRIAQQ